jgi:hypothetical protein
MSGGSSSLYDIYSTVLYTNLRKIMGYVCSCAKPQSAVSNLQANFKANSKQFIRKYFKAGGRLFDEKPGVQNEMGFSN